MLSVKKFRFGLRSLLIVTTLVAISCGWQIRLESNSQRFVEEVSNRTSSMVSALTSDAKLTNHKLLQETGFMELVAKRQSRTLWDIVLFRRRIVVSFATTLEEPGKANLEMFTHSISYSVGLFRRKVENATSKRIASVRL